VTQIEELLPHRWNKSNKNRHDGSAVTNQRTQHQLTVKRLPTHKAQIEVTATTDGNLNRIKKCAWGSADAYGQRAANIMTLIQSAKLNGLDPYAYLSDVLKRLPTHKATQIEELLPHRWKSNSN
jgi:hypothetical protein